MPVALEEELETLKDQLDDIINEREDEDLDYRRALWLDERYHEVDARIQEIEVVMAGKERFVADKRQRQARETEGSVVYDRRVVERLCGSSLAELVDVLSPQAVADLLGKPVRDGEKVYSPGAESGEAKGKPALDDVIQAASAIAKQEAPDKVDKGRDKGCSLSK